MVRNTALRAIEQNKVIVLRSLCVLIEPNQLLGITYSWNGSQMNGRILYHELDSDYARSRHLKLSTLKPGHLVRTNKERRWMITERYVCTPPEHIYDRMVREGIWVYYNCRNRLWRVDSPMEIHEEQVPALYVLKSLKTNYTTTTSGKTFAGEPASMVILQLEELTDEKINELLDDRMIGNQWLHFIEVNTNASDEASIPKEDA